MDVRITVLLLLFQVARWFSDILNYLITEYRAEAVESRYMALLVRSTPEREVLVRAMADDIVSCSSASASLQPSSETQGLPRRDDGIFTRERYFNFNLSLLQELESEALQLLK